MKQSMDLLGYAIAKIKQGDKEKLLTFIDHKGRKSTHDLCYYLRSINSLSKLEKQLIKEVKGDILDIGCATGYYIPALMKRGRVIGIDISPAMIKLARQSGLKNCFVANIFSYNPKKKFDTITLLENNIGLAGSLTKTKEFFLKLSSLLKPQGQILAIVRNIDNEPYYKIGLRPVWKDKIGPRFHWIIFNVQYLSEFLKKIGWKTKILGSEKNLFLLKIYKK